MSRKRLRRRPIGEGVGDQVDPKVYATLHHMGWHARRNAEMDIESSVNAALADVVFQLQEAMRFP